MECPERWILALGIQEREETHPVLLQADVIGPLRGGAAAVT